METLATRPALVTPIRTGDVEFVSGLLAAAQRNTAIVWGYRDLSLQIKQFTRTESDANWCTFATWSARLVGGGIRAAQLPNGLDRMLRYGPIGRLTSPLSRRLTLFILRRPGRSSASVHLAIGNRAVFYEIGTVLTRFLSRFADEATPSPARLQAYLTTVGAKRTIWPERRCCVDDTSGMAEVAPADLRRGLELLYQARFQDDPRRKAQLIWASNVSLAAYEQLRLQPVLENAMHAAPNWLMDLPRTLVGAHRPADRQPSRRRAWVLRHSDRMMTRRVMRLWVGPARLRIGHPLPAPPELLAERLAVSDELAELDGAAAQLAHRFGDKTSPRSVNYVDYDDRMRFIAAFFRVWQRSPLAFEAPYGPEQEAQIVHGHLVGAGFWKFY